MLWSSFEHHLTADRAIGADGRLPRRRCWKAAGSRGPGGHRTRPSAGDIVLQVLAQVPVLWVWDNVEPVTGFPKGTPSDWTQAEQDDLARACCGSGPAHQVQGAGRLSPRRAHLAG